MYEKTISVIYFCGNRRFQTSMQQKHSFHFNSFLYVVDQATQQTLGQDHFSNECQ